LRLWFKSLPPPHPPHLPRFALHVISNSNNTMVVVVLIVVVVTVVRVKMWSRVIVDVMLQEGLGMENLPYMGGAAVRRNVCS